MYENLSKGLFVYAIDIYLRIATAVLDTKLDSEDPVVAKKVEKRGKLLFEPGLLTALDNENLITNDHDDLVQGKKSIFLVKIREKSFLKSTADESKRAEC